MQEPPDSIVRKIHPSKIADVRVARRARVRVAARVGLERRSLSLVRYRLNDYSVPTSYGHRDVLVRGYVHDVVIS